MGLFRSSIENADLVDALWAVYQKDPSSVDASWQRVFSEGLYALPVEGGVKAGIQEPSTNLRIYDLVQAFRKYGHLAAQFNPIAKRPDKVVPELELGALGFSNAELDQNFPTGGLLAAPVAPLKDIVAVLQEIYCGRIGVEYVDLGRKEIEDWLQQRIEASRFRPILGIEEKQLILEHLNKSELLEVFLHTKFVGQKRFSLEGGETLIPVLATIVERGSELGLNELVIGMAHRGRLNVLTSILKKSYSMLFHEFEDTDAARSFGGSGDVKYHKGFSSVVQTAAGKEMRLHLAANASHLESVDPIVMGEVRAWQIAKGDEKEQTQVMPILIHGDAAVAGQGVVYETMQMGKLSGYSCGGAIHIVVNNQIGFTTLPKDSRSTRYCTDIARTFSAPVFHVNAEDPEGCVYVTHLAVELRQKFHCDVFIELNCYRKYGHNEADEPAFTQPLEYKLIRAKSAIRVLYRDQLVHEGLLERHIAESLEVDFRKALDAELEEIRRTKNDPPPPAHPEQKIGMGVPLFEQVDTRLDLKTIKEVAAQACQIPTGFNTHKKIQQLMEDRFAMVEGAPDEKKIDWGMGETLAYGTLLWQGKSVRLSGQDSRRGTFSHRHAMVVDQETNDKFFPLSHLKRDQGRFDVFNSPLSEFAVLGFDLGYSYATPNVFVLWEAQFGDFSNGAQIIIDQYLATAEQKWDIKSGLTLLLPHGFEGAGPEHSSARMERFLQLAGDHNVEAVNPSTPAQIYHLLRRQALRQYLKPLVVFTPKELLRHPLCRSSVRELAEGRFQTLLDDPMPAQQTRRLLLCSGHVYYALMAEREKRKATDISILRVEQLYPLDVEVLQGLLRKYSSFEECFWVQEEPSNMGPWDFIRPQISPLLPAQKLLRYVGRRRSASPATGSHAVHHHEHEKLLQEAFGE